MTDFTITFNTRMLERIVYILIIGVLVFTYFR